MVHKLCHYAGIRGGEIMKIITVVNLDNELIAYIDIEKGQTIVHKDYEVIEG